jgi:hypothetical protein
MRYGAAQNMDLLLVTTNYVDFNNHLMLMIKGANQLWVDIMVSLKKMERTHSPTRKVETSQLLSLKYGRLKNNDYS